MNSGQAQPRKVAVPSPLPTRRGEVQLPQKLRQDVKTALLHKPGAVPRIQSTLAANLEAEGWNERLKAYLTEALTNADDGEINDDDLIGRVVQSLKAVDKDNTTGDAEEGAVAERELWPGEAKARNGLQVSQTSVDSTVHAVKRELEAVCAVVDAVDWDG